MNEEYKRVVGAVLLSRRRMAYVYDLVCRHDTVSLMSAEEIDALIDRAETGEFDDALKSWPPEEWTRKAQPQG